jgi:hypothetical protein
MLNFILIALTAAAVLLLPGRAVVQVKHYPLESADGLILHNVTAEPVALHGKKGLRLTLSEETRRRLERMTPEGRNQRSIQQLARIKDLEFSSGVIEVELAGAPAPGAPAGACGLEPSLTSGT